jgi:hypothetical protein
MKTWPKKHCIKNTTRVAFCKGGAGWIGVATAGFLDDVDIMKIPDGFLESRQLRAE